jgi:hypothetical protein
MPTSDDALNNERKEWVRRRLGAVDPSGGSGAVNAPLPSDAPTGAGQESGTAANVNVPADPLQPQMVVGQGSDEVDQAAAAPVDQRSSVLSADHKNILSNTFRQDVFP